MTLWKLNKLLFQFSLFQSPITLLVKVVSPNEWIFKFKISSCSDISCLFCECQSEVSCEPINSRGCGSEDITPRQITRSIRSCQERGLLVMQVYWRVNLIKINKYCNKDQKIQMYKEVGFVYIYFQWWIHKTWYIVTVTNRMWTSPRYTSAKWKSLPMLAIKPGTSQL